MYLYECYVPKNEYIYAKDLAILIYNCERKHFPKLTNSAYEKKLAKRIRMKYKAASGMKTLVEILKEDYKEVKTKYATPDKKETNF